MIVICLSVAVFLFFIFAYVLPSVLTNYKDWKYYKKIYKNLNSLEFKEGLDLVYGYYHDEQVFIWFRDNNSFLLDMGNNVYLHSEFGFLCDPYALYWHIKYKRWFKKNYTDFLNLQK